jgi:hypothetical protein
VARRPSAVEVNLLQTDPYDNRHDANNRSTDKGKCYKAVGCWLYVAAEGSLVWMKPIVMITLRAEPVPSCRLWKVSPVYVDVIIVYILAHLYLDHA